MSGAQQLEQARRLLAQRSVEAALDAFQDAAARGADSDACAAGRWECAMLLGRYEQAWSASEEIEARQRAAGVASTERLWDGQPLTGKHVMLRCLHGYGDALQFIRYAPLIRAQAATLCVETHAELLPLLRACRGVDHAITWGEGAPPEPPRWDMQIEIMEVPRIFRTTYATLPVAEGYLEQGRLTADGETRRMLQGVADQRKRGRLQVGISWRSSGWDPRRTMPLELLAQAFPPAAACDLYSLQQGGAAELQALPQLRIQNIEAEFSDLAARVAGLDVVVTIDGVLAHLAGALGTPVLLLLPYAGDWRWGLGETTPWYPRTRLFRQGQPGDWWQPVRQAAAALLHLTGR